MIRNEHECRLACARHEAEGLVTCGGLTVALILGRALFEGVYLDHLETAARQREDHLAGCTDDARIMLKARPLCHDRVRQNSIGWALGSSE